MITHARKGRISWGQLPNLRWYHIWGGGLFLGVCHVPIPSPPAHPNILVLLYLCLHHLTQNDHVRQDNTWGREYFFGSATPPIPRKQIPSAPQFWVPFMYVNYVYIILCRTTEFSMVTQMWEGSVSWGQSCLPCQEGVTSADSNLGGSFLLLRTQFDLEQPNLVW